MTKVTQNKFYQEEALILEQFQHLKTPLSILNSLADLKKRKYEKHGAKNRQEEISFVEYSLAYCHKKGASCPREIFHWYDEPLFHKLTKSQLNWYFYWRGCFLKGQYLETDLGYVMMFIFELINYSFNPNAAFNVSLMLRVLHAYGEEFGIKRSLTLIIDDMLKELAYSRPLSEPLRSEKPELYEALEKEQDLTKISITCWKPYFSSYRKTKFFQYNRNKIYKTFKECLFMLEAECIENETTLLNSYFEVKLEKRKKRLYPGAVVYRQDPSTLLISVNYERIYETEKLYWQISNYIRLAENVTRLLNGENSQLKIEKTALPNGLKEKMLDYMERPKKKKQRAKKMLDQEGMAREKNLSNGQSETLVQFDEDRIKQLQAEAERLVEAVDQRAKLYEEEAIAAQPWGPEINSERDNHNVQPTDTEDFNTQLVTSSEDPSTSLEQFFVSKGDKLDEEQIETFIKKLDPLELKLLQNFSELTLTKEEAAHDLKKAGRMIGSVLTSINEKALEQLEENLLEEKGQHLVIYEGFQELIDRLKEEV